MFFYFKGVKNLKKYFSKVVIIICITCLFLSTMYIMRNFFKDKEQNQIFAVFKTTADEKGFYYYKFINSNSEREFFTFIQKCKELSFYETNKKVEYRNKLITLSTCEYSNKNGRLVIVAKY